MVGIRQRKWRGTWRGSGFRVGRDCLPFLGGLVFPCPHTQRSRFGNSGKGGKGDLTLSDLPAQTWAWGGHRTHLGRIDDGRGVLREPRLGGPQMQGRKRVNKRAHALEPCSPG